MVNPLFVDGTVYLTTCHGEDDQTFGYVRALDAETGATIWNERLPAYATGGAVVDDGTVYCGSSTGHLGSPDEEGAQPDDSFVFAFDAETGEQYWQTPTPGGIRSPPAVASGTVYVGTSADGHVRAFDAETGTERWSVDPGYVVASKPAIVDETVYVGCHDGMYAFDATTGTEKWQYPVSSIESTHVTGVWSSPTVVDGVAYVGGGDGAVHAVDALTGRRVWQYDIGEGIMSSTAVTTETVYVSTLEGTVCAVDRKTGEAEWTFDAGPGIRASPIVVNGRVFVGTMSADERVDEDSTPDSSSASWLFDLDASGGAVQWQTTVEGSVRGSLSASPGTVYLGAGSALYAFQ